MEALSQLDVSNPDHVSVITRDGKVTVSVLKDGTSVTLGFPINKSVFDTTPRPPLQQPAPQMMAVIRSQSTNPNAGLEATKREDKRNFRQWDGPSKLNAEKVKEIRMLLADMSLRRSCGNVTTLYSVIGKKFGVTGCTISNIARGIAWRDVK